MISLNMAAAGWATSSVTLGALVMVTNESPPTPSRDTWESPQTLSV